MDHESGRAPEQGGARWDTSGMTSSYCNVVSAGATREAVALNLGLSHGSGRPHAETTVELLHRIVLAPLTAKHLHQLLGRLIDEHDAQRGALR